MPRALQTLGYAEETVEAIVEYIAEHGHVVDAPGLRPEHYEVFDCAAGQPRSIVPMGHVRMMAAVQPFLSGAISKTVNMPESATVEEIEDVYLQGWHLGLKALAVYRDNCKVGQPLSDAKAKGAPTAVPAKDVVVEYRPVRKRLPKSRPSRTTSFTVGGAEGYMTAGSYPDDGLGEVFLKLGKQGSTLAGVMDAFSIAVSIALQYGVPLETYVEKFTNMRFEPSGMTDDPDVRMASSVVDYIFRRLALDHLDFETRSALGIYTAKERAHQLDTGVYEPVDVDVEALRQSAPVAGSASTAESSRPLTRCRAEEQPTSSRGAPPRAEGRAHLDRAARGVTGHHGRRAALLHLRHQDATSAAAATSARAAGRPAAAADIHETRGPAGVGGPRRPGASSPSEPAVGARLRIGGIRHPVPVDVHEHLAVTEAAASTQVPGQSADPSTHGALVSDPALAPAQRCVAAEGLDNAQQVAHQGTRRRGDWPRSRSDRARPARLGGRRPHSLSSGKSRAAEGPR